jgi:hypothetical protein
LAFLAISAAVSMAICEGFEKSVGTSIRFMLVSLINDESKITYFSLDLK